MGLITSVFLYTFLLQKVFADALPPQLQTVADFVTKKQSCVVAIAEVPKDEKMYKNAFSPAWRKQLLCVQDITINVGSIDEVKGCAFTWYDSTTNKYLPVQSMDSFGRAPMAIVKNKSCTSGGFEQLIKLKLGVYGASSVWGKITSASNPESKLVVIADTSASIKKLVEDGIQEAIKQEQIAANKREIAKKIADEKAKKKEIEDKKGRTIIDGGWSTECMENKETHKEFGGYDQGMKLAIFIDKKSFYSVVMFWGERGHDCGNDPDFSIEVNGTLSVDAKGESGAIKFTPKKVYFGRAAYSTFKEYLNEKKLFGKSDWNNSKISNFDLSKVEFISSVLKESSSQFKISKDESNENLIQFSAGIPFAVVKEFSSKSANNDLIDITFSEVPKIYFKHYRPTDDE